MIKKGSFIRAILFLSLLFTTPVQAGFESEQQEQSNCFRRALNKFKVKKKQNQLKGKYKVLFKKLDDVIRSIDENQGILINERIEIIKHLEAYEQEIRLYYGSITLNNSRSTSYLPEQLQLYLNAITEKINSIKIRPLSEEARLKKEEITEEMNHILDAAETLLECKQEVDCKVHLKSINTLSLSDSDQPLPVDDYSDFFKNLECAITSFVLSSSFLPSLSHATQPDEAIARTYITTAIETINDLKRTIFNGVTKIKNKTKTTEENLNEKLASVVIAAQSFISPLEQSIYI